MELSAGVDLPSLLDGMEGIAYVTSSEGVIQAYGRANWDKFALRNDAPELTQPDTLCGRSLFEFITGSQARAAHEVAAEAVRSGRRDLVTYTYRCDAPTLRREMRMTLTPLTEEGRLVGLLYQSVILRETPHGPFPLRERRVEPLAASALVVRICTYCRSVRYPPEADEDSWITPERYYEVGGSEEVRISHGICPDCWTTIAEPLLADIRGSDQAG